VEVKPTWILFIPPMPVTSLHNRSYFWWSDGQELIRCWFDGPPIQLLDLVVVVAFSWIHASMVTIYYFLRSMAHVSYFSIATWATLTLMDILKLSLLWADLCTCDILLEINFVLELMMDPLVRYTSLLHIFRYRFLLFHTPQTPYLIPPCFEINFLVLALFFGP